MKRPNNKGKRTEKWEEEEEEGENRYV